MPPRKSNVSTVSGTGDESVKEAGASKGKEKEKDDGGVAVEVCSNAWTRKLPEPLEC
jgi:hypothetical protein